MVHCPRRFPPPHQTPFPVPHLSLPQPLLGVFMPLQAFWQSDIVGKLITLLLIGVSLYIGGVIVSKWMSLRGYKSYNRLFLRAFEGHPHPSYLFLDPRGLVSGSPIGSVYIDGMRELVDLLHRHGVADTSLRSWQEGQTLPILTPSEIEAVRSACERSLAKQQLVLEANMSRISTAISAAPSLGLLGTVWGVMGAFMSMSSGGATMISAVAPGISGALLTTVAGLIVAIPSTIFYNILAGIIRRHVVALENFEDEFMTDVIRLHSQPDGPLPLSMPQAAVQVMAVPGPVPAPAPTTPAVPQAPLV